ncbi:MAG TPA: hypothetical protein VGL79_06905, partial [Solirubrobacteraceae bacterium]
RAISDGALGISPNEHRAPTRGARHATEATSVLASATRTHSPSEGRGAVVPRQPRRGPAREAPPVVATAPTRQRGSGLRRLAFALLALLALVGVIAVIVVLSAPATTTIKLRTVVYNDAQESAEALKQLVDENTK